MSQRLLLVDSDIFVLLSAAGLLQQLAEALGYPMESVRRLAALPHQLQRGKSFKRYSADGHASALKNCELIEPITDRPTSNELYERLLAVADPGEASLIAMLAEDECCLLTTGDAKALVAFGTSNDLADVRNRVRGRIVCLEVAVKLLVQKFGADVVGPRFKALAGVNNTIDVFFRHKDTFENGELPEQIDSYLRDLKRRIGDDILYPV